MTLSIEIGHQITKDVQKIPGKTVRFVAEDGRTMFEVSAQKDGKTIEVRTVENTMVGGVLFSTQMIVVPNFSNSVLITAYEYDLKENDRVFMK